MACCSTLPPRVGPPVSPLRCGYIVSASSRHPNPVATQPPPPSGLLTRLRGAAAAGALATALALTPVVPGAMPAHAQPAVISNEMPVLDLARVVPSGRLDSLQQELKDLESATGWRVRMLTRYGPSNEPSVEAIRAGWSVDSKTIVVFVDPTSPNIMSFKFGRGVREALSPAFFTELQGRYGNMFNVREQGESAAVLAMMGALTGCLAQGGCFVVPGLTPDHYFFTLALSVAGGVVAGAAARLEPQGFVQRREVWVLLFSPLWATLFINFGLGPVLTRTSDLLPVAGNLAGFLLAALAVGYQHQVARLTGLTVDDPEP